MAAKHEGIALLSMYNDEEDDEDVEDVAGDGYDGEGDGGSDNGGAPPPTESSILDTPPIPQSRTPPSSDEHADSKTLIGRIQQWSPRRTPTPPPQSLFETLDPPRTRIGALAIVDYAHDEAAMSPELEEGEIMSVGEAMIGVEIEVSDGYFEETVAPGSIHILSSAQAEHNYPSDLPEQFNSETTAMDFIGLESEIALAESASTVYEETREDDPLTNFLPPPTTKKCPEELQEKYNKFLAYKKAGKSFNSDLRNRKDYRNPDFLQHAVRYQEIDQIGTCFSKHVFDPHGYDKSDYYDELEADMKREIEKKEQERKRSPKVDFISGGTQPATVAPVPKISTQIPAGAASGMQSASNAADAVTNRQNKKTKWDKVDSDAKVPLQSGGNDNLLSVANAGTGYTAFAQQKRKEAEEKKSNLWKLEKNS